MSRLTEEIKELKAQIRKLQNEKDTLDGENKNLLGQIDMYKVGVFQCSCINSFILRLPSHICSSPIHNPHPVPSLSQIPNLFVTSPPNNFIILLLTFPFLSSTLHFPFPIPLTFIPLNLLMILPTTSSLKNKMTKIIMVTKDASQGCISLLQYDPYTPKAKFELLHIKDMLSLI